MIGDNMAQVTSGQVLRETRERKGYDADTVARRLRIRTDILKAIESNDFNNMPPRGYTRNMINAYARLLGLNPTEIVNMYLDEAYANQVKRARNNPTNSRMNSERLSSSNRNKVTRRPVANPATTGTIQGNLDDIDEQITSPRSPKRRLFDDRTQYSRDDYGIPRYSNSASVRNTRRSSGDYLSNHSGYADYPEEGYDYDYGYQEEASPASAASRRSSNMRSQRMHRQNSERRRQGQIYTDQASMRYNSSRSLGISSRLPLIIGIVIIVLIIAVVLFFIFGRGENGQSSDVSTLPVSGITDTTGLADDGEDDLTVEVAPTAARIVYSVAAGDSVYLEIYENGSETPKMEMLEGPTEKSVETDGTWTITTYTPDLINITVNGEPVELTPSADYNGMSAYTVDFSKILADWKSTHVSKDAQRSAALQSAAQAASDEAKAKEDAQKAASGDTSSSNTSSNNSSNTSSNSSSNSSSGNSNTN